MTVAPDPSKTDIAVGEELPLSDRLGEEEQDTANLEEAVQNIHHDSNDSKEELVGGDQGITNLVLGSLEHPLILSDTIVHSEESPVPGCGLSARN